MSKTFLGTFSFHLIRILEPLDAALGSDAAFRAFLYELGWNASGGIPSQYQALKSALDDLILLNNNSNTESATDSDIKNVINAFKNFYMSIKGLTVAPTGVDSTTFLAEFPERVFELLIVRYLNQYQGRLFTVLQLLGIIELISVPAASGRPRYTRLKLHYDRFATIISDPLLLLKTNIGWNSTNYSFSLMSKYVLDLLAGIGVPALLQNTTVHTENNFNSSFNTNLKIKNQVSAYLFSKLGTSGFLSFNPSIHEAIGSTISNSGLILQVPIPALAIDNEITTALSFSLNTANLADTTLAFLITPTMVAFRTPFQQTSLSESNVSLSLKYASAEPKLLLGKSNATRLQLNGCSLLIECKRENNEVEIILSADLSGLQFVLNSGDSDGFIKNVSGSGDRIINLPIIVSWSSKHGIAFKGSGGFEISTSPNKSFGPITVNELLLALKAVDQQPLKLEVGATISGKFSAFSFIVKNIGMGLSFEPNEGNAGPFGIDLGFKPPNGIGLDIITKGITGGGYLYFDKDKGKYYGAIELDLFDKIHVTAIGIVTTKNPDGSPGFSMLVMISVEFPGIPLGFGFSLNGIGGMAGVHRNFNTNAIRDSVRTGAIDRIMFPRDVVANINTIIVDLEQYFPAEQNRHTFGLFFLLKWGVGVPLVDIKIGVIISLPEPVKVGIVGVIRVALPDPDLPVLRLNVAFAGIIDFENKYLTFDASIFDSRLLFLSLEGDMAVRVFWGEHKEMVVAVGGFHPAFHAPAYLMLPEMRRLSISLFDQDNLRLVIATYFAVTSNTVQFGVALDFLLRVSEFKVVGKFGFDVLFQFNPFKFMTHVWAYLGVLLGERELLCISLDFSLQGPGPWHAVGKGEFTAGPVSYSANFEKTWGDKPDTTVPPIAVKPIFLDALNKDENWQGIFPQNRKQLVKLLPSATGPLLMDPMGDFAVSQKVIPLKVKIEKYGGKKAIDAGEYSLADLKLSSVSVDKAKHIVDVKENFAPAQFKDMDDQKKLEAASFEYLAAGWRVNNNFTTIEMGDFVTMDIDYDTTIIDNIHRVPATDTALTTLDAELVNSFVSGGAIFSNPVAQSRRADAVSPINKVIMKQEGFKLRSRDGLKDAKELDPSIATTTTGSLAEAFTVRERIVKANPSLANLIELVPNF